MAPASEPASGSLKAKAAIFFAAGHQRQIRRLLHRRARQCDGAAAQPLHRKGEVGQRRMKGQCLAQDHQRARVEFFECTAQCAVLACRHAVAQPAFGTQQAHPFLAGPAIVALVDVLPWHPLGQARTQLSMNLVKKG
jgi:hypothetical protein